MRRLEKIDLEVMSLKTREITPSEHSDLPAEQVEGSFCLCRMAIPCERTETKPVEPRSSRDLRLPVRCQQGDVAT